MATHSGDSGTMTDVPPRQDLPEPVEERQMAGYRIRDPRPPEDREKELTTRQRERQRTILERVHQIVDYVFLVLYSLLTVRLLLALAAANQNAGFVRFIRAITQPFFAPFVDIVPSPAMGNGTFDLPVVICMLAYLLLHVALRGLLHVALGPRRPAREG